MPSHRPRPQPTPPIPALLLLLLVAAHLPAPLRAQRPGATFPSWAVNRFHSVSTTAPITRRLLSRPGYNASIAVVLSHVARVEAAVLRHVREERPPTSDQLLRPCNAPVFEHATSVNGVFPLRGLPDPVVDCVTVFDDDRLFEGETPRISLRDLVDAVDNKFRVDNENAPFVRDEVVLPWAKRTADGFMASWQRISTSSDFPWERGSKRCRVSAVGLTRIGADWHIDMAFTNDRNVVPLPDYKRQYIAEWVHISDAAGSNMKSMMQRSPSYLNETTSGPPVNDTTTIFTRFSGQAGSGKFKALHVENNFALIDAAEKADLGVQQGDDALAPSNLAILLLPLALNLVPISLLSYVSSTMMLLYMLMSDVLTVIPLAIKGAELVYLGRAKHQSAALRLTSTVNGTLGAAAAGEFWTAECGAKGSFSSIGIAFLCLAFGFMIAGIIAELWARNFTKRRMLREAEKKSNFVRVQSDEHYDDTSYISTLKTKEMEVE